MGKMIIKDGVRYTPELAERLGIEADETVETTPAHEDGVLRVDGAPAAVVAVGSDPVTSDGTVISSSAASAEGSRQEGTLPGHIGTVGAPAPVNSEEGSNDGATSGTDTGTATVGESGGPGASAEKAGKRPARGAGAQAGK